MQIESNDRRLKEIFHPLATERQDEAKDLRFVHYTDAGAAMSILQNEEIWMRKTLCMSDYREILHGLELLRRVYHGTEGRRFTEVLNSLFPGFNTEIEQLFNGWVPKIHTDTFITCVSEHRPQDDQFGRLSMWRAYGKSVGVALVLNNKPFFTPTNALKTFVCPIAYVDEEKFSSEFCRVVTKITDNKDFLAQQGREKVKNYVFNMLAFGILTTKHLGFTEEAEWRVIHCPWWNPPSPLKREVKLIQGAPQPVYKIALKNVPEAGLCGIEIRELVDRVIIGPCRDPIATAEAFSDLLSQRGVVEADKRICMSSIPLRY